MQVGGTVRAEGDLDFRGTLVSRRTTSTGRLPRDPPALRLEHDADEEKLATLMRLTERYCVVFQDDQRGSAGHDRERLSPRGRSARLLQDLEHPDSVGGIHRGGASPCTQSRTWP